MGRVTPPERFDPAGAWKFGDLASPAISGFTAGDRLDPYWDGLWGTGSAASWLSIDLARRQMTAGLGKLPRELDRSPVEVDQQLDARRGWQERLAFLGALFSWRTMTVEQAAAFTGAAPLARPTNPSPAALFASGLVDLGVFSNGLQNTDLTGRGAVYRTGKGPVFDDDFRDRLTWAEWTSVTGGQRWAPSSNYDRHNILATELGLRFAEFSDVGTVLGERFSSLDMLVGSGLGRASLAHDQRAADLVVVRPDGMRVAIEMTANTGSHFLEKVRKWAVLLAENPLALSGLCVVFVVIQHPERLAENDGFIPRSQTYQAIASAVRHHPGSVRDRVAERMGVATWREWFPERGSVHEAFMAMRVDRPTGRGSALWEPCDMLDSQDVAASGVPGRPFEANDHAAMTAVIENAALLGNTPAWVRRATPKGLSVSHSLLANANLSSVPHPEPVRANRSKGRRVGQGVGAARDARLPRRLRGLSD